MATVLEKRPQQRIVEVNIAPRRGAEGAWNVEAIDDDGSIEQAIFAGPNAEARARRYADWEYRA